MATFLAAYYDNDSQPLYINLDHVQRIDRPQSEGETEKGEPINSARFWITSDDLNSLRLKYRKADFERLVKRIVEGRP